MQGDLNCCAVVPAPDGSSAFKRRVLVRCDALVRVCQCQCVGASASAWARVRVLKTTTLHKYSRSSRAYHPLLSSNHRQSILKSAALLLHTHC